MSFEEIYEQFNSLDRKGFDENDVASSLRSVIEKEERTATTYENFDIIAFDFHENHPNKETGWGTYFGPKFVFPKDGVMYESPSIKLVTKSVIEYWMERAKNAVNPILRARYNGLIYDFIKLKTENKPSIQVKKEYITSLLDVAAGEYYKYDILTYHKIERAIEVALLIKDQALITRAKEILIKYEETHGTDNFPGLWGYSFDLLIDKKNISLLEEEETHIIKELDDKFLRLLNSDQDKNSGHRSAEQAGTRLAFYYKKRNLDEKVWLVINSLCDAIENATADKSAMHVTYHLNRNYKLYKKFQLNDAAKATLLKLRSESPKTASEMQVIKTHIDIPTSKIQKLLDYVVSGTIEDVYHKIVGQNINKKSEIANQLRNSAKQAPFGFLISKQIQDGKGRIIAVVGNLQNDFEGNFYHYFSRNLTISSIFLIQTIDFAIKKMNLNTTHILANIERSPIFDDNRTPIIERGLQSFFDKDYLVSIHLLIPQIEEAIRNAVELLGGNVLRQNQSGDVFMLRTLDELLTDEKIIKLFGEDMSAQFRVLFTDQRGWNLRNNVCHGIAETQSFNAQTAYWVIHSLMYLSMIQATAD